MCVCVCACVCECKFLFVGVCGVCGCPHTLIGIRGLSAVARGYIGMSFVLSVAASLLTFVGPMCLQGILQYLQDPSIPTSTGAGLVAAVGLAASARGL